MEALFTSFAHGKRVPLTIVRPSNLYGPGQVARPGFGLVRVLLEKALQGEPLEVWGDGSAVRDYLFIDDAVEAFERLIAQPDLSGTFNIGSGVGTSISGLIRLAERVTGREIGIIPRPAREVDVRVIVLNTARLRAATGWMPRRELEPGLGRTWAWLRAEGAASGTPGLE